MVQNTCSTNLMCFQNGDLIFDDHTFLYASKLMILEEYKIPYQTSCISRNEPRFGSHSRVDCRDVEIDSWFSVYLAERNCAIITVALINILKN